LQYCLDAELPIPDGGLSDTDVFIDFSLKKTEVHESFADVVTDRIGFSACTYILKVARTIADPDGSASIHEQPIAEVIQYCSLDRKIA